MSIKELFLKAPDNQIDPAIKALIMQWDDEPTALQMLCVLDAMVHGAAASGFAVSALDAMMRGALEAEGKTYEQLVKQATWRNEP